MCAFMVNIVLPSQNPAAVKYMRDTLEDTHSIYIVCDFIPKELSRTNSVVFFTRLSAQVYLELSDFARLGNLVPQLLAQYDNLDSPPSLMSFK